MSEQKYHSTTTLLKSFLLTGVVFNVQYACDIDNLSLTQTEIKLTSDDVCERQTTGGNMSSDRLPLVTWVCSILYFMGHTTLLAVDNVKCFKVKLKLIF
ncbi:hypothetical protein L211DRAFT_833317, partial [Terfezia boudieri ATCC MYA-4762]